MPRSWGIEGAMLIVTAAFFGQGCYYVLAIAGARTPTDAVAR
jgi:hypothetical protein